MLQMATVETIVRLVVQQYDATDFLPYPQLTIIRDARLAGSLDVPAMLGRLAYL